MSKSKISISPADITKNWKSGMTGAVTKIVTGVNAITDNPMEAAANAGQKMAQKVAEAVASGRHAAGCRKVSLSQWKELTSAKVQARLSQGVESATNKHLAFANWLVPRVNSGLGTIASMSKMTLEDSIARQVAWTRFMAGEKYKK